MGDFSTKRRRPEYDSAGFLAAVDAAVEGDGKRPLSLAGKPDIVGELLATKDGDKPLAVVLNAKE